MRPEALIVAGTDTSVGKTVVSAALMLALDAYYWKPVQSGTINATDTDAVRRMTALPEDRFLPETYRLREPLSPHRSAELGGIRLDPVRISRLPATAGRLIVETAGGLLVPLTRDRLQIDILSAWNAPVVLVARSGLGTINHTLLSVEALRRRSIPLKGLVFVGKPNPDNERTVLDFTQARLLGRIPPLERLNADALRAAFDEHFDRDALTMRAYA